MFAKTPIKFAQEAIRSKKNPKENVCVAATATCGPPGHPCETCMHLKGLSTKRRQDKDLCLIAPRSLVRPIHYKRYFNRGVTVPPYLPTAKVSGQLKEVEVPDICSAEQINNQIIQHHQREMDRKFQDTDDSSTPYLISHNVYIEHNGRFTKAPKHLLQLGDYATRVCYLEDIGGPEFNTPLDLAMFLQTIFTYLAKVIIGMLAGLALIELCILMKLIPTVEEDLHEFFRVYSSISGSFFMLSSIFNIIALIALFDWMDMAHMNLRHLWDTYLHRTIWMVVLPFFIAFFLRKFNGDIDDAIFLHGDIRSDYRIQAADSPLSEDLDFRKSLYRWQVRLMCADALIIVGWCLMVITRNDDLFQLHLECMKKYDMNEGQRAHKDEMPQRVPTGELSPAPEDYTAVFAADSFDLSLLPSTLQGVGLCKETEFGFPWSPIKEESLVPQEGLPWSPIKEEPLSEEESDLGPIPDHKLLREVLKDTSFQKRYNLIPVPVGELGTGFRAEMEEVSMDLAQEEIQPVLSMAMEQLKTEIHSTCAVLGISREPSKWTVEEVETWLAWNLAQFSLPLTNVQFFKISGHTLAELSEQEFIERAPECGGLLYAQLELWKAASMEETKVDVSGLLGETTTTRSGSSSGDPSDDEDDEEMTDVSQASPKSSSSRGGGVSHIHLWQFLKELLASPALYGNCIRWLDRPAGVFKIEDSVRVARLWGKRKNRPAMNYDKLSRSIRQYYKKGIMKKTERSQRLVYQFCHPYSL